MIRSKDEEITSQQERQPASLLRAMAASYSVEEEIGSGGMARVYRARDLKHKRPVAVKVLRDDLAGSIGAERFTKEIEIAAQLQHPHILTVYDSGEVDGSLYYVMPLVEGESLRDRLMREKQLPVDDALQIIQEVCDAVGYANSHGIVHRDLKPENVMLGAGHALVTDFGIATALSQAGGERLTERGITLGTPMYMSPEQAGGDDVDPRSDVYALGCVMYEMLAGEPPFTGRTSQAILAQQVAQPPPSLDIVRPTTPPGVIGAVERALQKVPADRYQTAKQFAEALRSQSEPVRRRDPGSPRAKTWMLAVLPVLAVAAWGVRMILDDRSPNLDANKLIVFPLEVRDFPAADSGMGYNIAVAIGAQLEHTDPLRWEDGRGRLLEEERARIGSISLDRYAQIALDRGAGFFIEGVVLREGEERAAVTLRLHHARQRLDVISQSATGWLDADARAIVVGMTAMRRLLPSIIDRGRETELDLDPIMERDPTAIALWIEGEKSYRNSRFSEALEFYERAVGEDSLLAFAAFKGAQAASWENHRTEARSLLNLALSSGDLSGTYATFANGLVAYQSGAADSAAALFQQVVEERPYWAEGHMALGEVYFHLLPSDGDFETNANAAFEIAWARDSGFAPAAFHLAEIAVRRGDVDRARRYHDSFNGFEPDSQKLRQLALELGCIENTLDSAGYADLAAEDAAATLRGAKALTVGGRNHRCAERGFRAVLASPTASRNEKWGALVGLQGVLLMTNRSDEAVGVIDAAIERGIRTAMLLYAFGYLSGTDMMDQALEVAEFFREATDGTYDVSDPQYSWMLGATYAFAGDLDQLEDVFDSLEPENTRGRREQHYASLLTAHRALAWGDTVAAIDGFRAITTSAPVDSLSWRAGEAHELETVLLAEILESRGHLSEAHDLAARLDHGVPFFFLQYVPRSLAIRYRAALGLGRHEQAADYRRRLLGLGWGELISSEAINQQER